MAAKPGILSFAYAFFERIWGGSSLAARYGFDIPSEKKAGEVWLISGHPSFDCRVAEGAFAGKTLNELVAEYPSALLGEHARPGRLGRFPLLLKLLDCADILSVQVHPDDQTARRLGEPDDGKTEMWHVLDAAPGSELICGLDPSLGPRDFSSAIQLGTIDAKMQRLVARTGDSLFVPAGTVHAIGKGIVLAEIQQNSDLTYRVHDWGRRQPDGTLRTLHVAKALEAVHFGALPAGIVRPLSCQCGGASCSVLAACPYFAARLFPIDGCAQLSTYQDSFHILLGKTGVLSVVTDEEQHALRPGHTLLVSARCREFRIAGLGECLDYFVPRMDRDILNPLRTAGYMPHDLLQLGIPG